VTGREPSSPAGPAPGPAEPEYGLPESHEGLGELGERIAYRKAEKARKQKKFRTRFYVLSITLTVLIAGFILSLSGLFTVDSIDVQGNAHYSTEEIINMSHAVPGRNIIYHANKDEITSYLENNPYIKKAVVTRKLPSTLVITVTERNESLAFKYDDDYLILDDDGILLKKTRNVPKVTLVEGNVVNRIKLGEVIGTEDDERLSDTLSLIKAASRADMYFVRVDMSTRRMVRAYIYDTLMVRTDYDTLMTNLNNGRLHLVVSRLFEDGIRRGTITFAEDGTASFMPII